MNHTNRSESDTVRWRFGDVELDEATRKLSRDGASIEIERKPYEVLRVLLRHAGEVVTKDELAEQVWTRRVMDDQVIARTVSKLRGVLGDAEQKIVKTVYGHGYQLAVPVRVLPAVSAAPLLRLNLRAGENPPLRPEWQLVETLGAGGFGEVWLGRHESSGETRVFKFAADGPGLSALKREVTLFRLIRDGLPDADAVVRLLGWNFEQAPYFVESEYVAGGNLETWAQAQGGLGAIPLETRLDLIAQIAEALAAVHGLGVLHKDLKPANVLVAEGAKINKIKLCDFGSGRVLDEARLKALGITRQGFTQTLATDSSTSGTLHYLAPEVLAGQPATARADIYALGVMLYQLVVGDFREALAAGWERKIEDPLLRQDIATAADGDPTMRLADASLLAQRLRSLDSRRAESLRAHEQQQETERLRAQAAAMRARRPWVVLAGTALVVGLLLSVGFGWRAQLARIAAERDRSSLQAVNRFLTEDLIAAADPFNGGRQDMSMREVLDVAAASVATRFVDRPAEEVVVRRALGLAYSGLHAFDQAGAQHQAGIARALSLGDAGVDLANDLRLDGVANDLSLDHRAAARRRLDAVRAAPHRTGLATLMCDFYDAELRFLSGQQEPAIAEMQALAPRFQRLIQAGDSRGADDYWDYMADLSLAQTEAGHWPDAVRTLRPLFRHYLRELGANHALTLDVQSGLGMALVFSGQAAEGLAMSESALAGITNRLGATDEVSLRAAQEFGAASLRAGDPERAEKVLQDALGSLLQTLGERDRLTRLTQRCLAEVYLETDRAAAALAILEPLVPLAQTLDGMSHPEMLRLEMLLGRTFADLGQTPRALETLQHAYRLAPATFGAGHWRVSQIAIELAHVHALSGDQAGAARLSGDAIVRLREALSADDPDYRRAVRLTEP